MEQAKKYDRWKIKQKKQLEVGGVAAPDGAYTQHNTK